VPRVLSSQRHGRASSNELDDDCVFDPSKGPRSGAPGSNSGVLGSTSRTVGVVECILAHMVMERRRTIVVSLVVGLAGLASACESTEQPRAEPSIASKPSAVGEQPIATKPVVGEQPSGSKPPAVGEQPAASPAKPEPTTPVSAPAAAPSRLGVSPNPEHAVMIAGSDAEPGIVVLDASSEPVGRLVSAKVDWCRVDPRAGVVWYRHRPPGDLGIVGPGIISFVDLEGDGPPVTVAEKMPEKVVIQYSDEVLGQPPLHQFQEGVAILMEDPPRLDAILGCDGDMAVYCFGDDVIDIEPARKRALAKDRKAMARKPFLGAEAVAGLVARGKGRRAVPSEAPRGPEPERVTTVPAESCEAMPDECGKAKRLPGTPYWQVVVSNSRGDFYYEALGLYDPVEKVFFDPTDPKARGPVPTSSEPFIPTWVSPSGTRAMNGSTLVELAGGTLATGLGGACGFWGGGWESPSSD